MIKKTVIEKNLDRFINSNFDRKDRSKADPLKFEWFINSLHVWHCSSQLYNSKSQIGKDISLGNAQGGDAFFIVVNNEQIFTLNDGIDNVINYLIEKGKEITFHFIQTKMSQSADWGDFLKFIDIVLMILKGENIDKSQKELLNVKKFYDYITDETNSKLGKIKHRLEVYYYTNKNENDVSKLKIDWKNGIDRKENDLKDYIPHSKIEIRGSHFVNDLYEKFTANKYELTINKSNVIEVDEKKYLIGYLTANELLECIGPKTSNGERAILPDVFKNNIRLYIGSTPVNKNIERTLREEPEKFHFYNNGLTITTKEIDSSNSKQYLVTPVNIVNGCQTANSVYNIFKSEHTKESQVKIPVKIIVAADNEYEKITIRTNAQNGLEEKDLISITNIQKDLEEEFARINFLGKRFFYKRQNAIEIENQDIDYIIKIDDILRASFSTFMLIPNKVTGYYDQITDKYLDGIFDERFVKLYVIVTSTLKLIEAEIEENYPEFKRLKFHLCYLLYKFVNKNEDILSIAEYFKDRTNKNEDDSEDSDIIKSDLINKVNLNLSLILKSSQSFSEILKYIVFNLKKKYPILLDLSTKEKEKVLYKPVEKFRRSRTQPIFDNFNDVFTEDFHSIINNIQQ